MNSRPSTSSEVISSPGTSRSSGGHLPTTLAARSRAESSRGQQPAVTRRFEDFDVEDGDDTTMGAGLGSIPRKRPSGEGRMPRIGRKPRKTLNEEADESGFIFTRTSQQQQQQQPTSPHPSSPQPATPITSSSSNHRTISEALPSDQGGKTPINRKNRLYRTGLGTPAGKPRRPSELSREHRRSSLNFKEARSASTMREASNSYPHPGIPDKELYRHISVDGSPVTRMKTLAGWAMDRARAEVLASLPLSSAAPMAPRGKRARQEEAGSQASDSEYSAHEKKILERCRGTIEKVMIAAIQDLQQGKLDISWLTQPDAQSTHRQQAKRPNPENETNAALAQTLSAQADDLRAENAKWEQEMREIEAYEAETAALLKLASSWSSKPVFDSADVTSPPEIKHEEDSAQAELSWQSTDLDAESEQMMSLARQALAIEHDWVSRSRPANASSGTESDALQAALQAAAASVYPSERRKSKSKAIDDGLDQRLRGTQLDPRWTHFQSDADELHSRTHVLDRLGSRCVKYTDSVSLRAAQGLRRLAFGADGQGDGGAGSGTSPSAGPSASASDSREADRQRQDRLLSGVRESVGPLGRSDARVRGGESQSSKLPVTAHPNDDSGVQINELDQSAVDIFRAFSRTGNANNGSSSSSKSKSNAPAKSPSKTKR